jgi:hypothetical protein
MRSCCCLRIAEHEQREYKLLRRWTPEQQENISDGTFAIRQSRNSPIVYPGPRLSPTVSSTWYEIHFGMTLRLEHVRFITWVHVRTGRPLALGVCNDQRVILWGWASL